MFTWDIKSIKWLEYDTHPTLGTYVYGFWVKVSKVGCHFGNENQRLGVLDFHYRSDTLLSMELHVGPRWLVQLDGY